jgi:O-acetyl-ADP-ribose deacetylase (regulator of RNase III)
MLAVILPDDVIVLHAGATLPAAVAVDAGLGVARRGAGELLPVVRTAATPSKWQYAETPTLWRHMPLDSAAKLDVLWSLHTSTLGPLVVRRVSMADTAYDIDFVAMTQTSAATGTSRSIRREPGSAEAQRAPPPLAPTTSASTLLSPKMSLGAPRAAGRAIVITDDDDLTDGAEILEQSAVRRGHYAETTPGSALPPPAPPMLSRRKPTLAGSPTTTKRLVFPSISTNIFKFDLDRAARIACEEVARFLAQYPASHCPHLELSLVDYGPDQTPTPTIKAFAQAWSSVGTADARFNFAICDFADPVSRGPCFAVVNASNATFSGGTATTGFNRAVYVAAGKCLEAATKAKYGGKADVGVAYPVELPTESPLRVSSGTRLVIHVVGPNMNPSRPNCLNGDYVIGVALLRNAYRQSLESYAAALGLRANQ